jgi:hypothetical protein
MILRRAAAIAVTLLLGALLGSLSLGPAYALIWSTGEAPVLVRGALTSGRSGTVRVTEIDGTPSGSFTTLKFSNGSLADNGDGTATITTGVGGGGDASTNTAVAVDGEVAVFSGTGGKTLKRGTGTGIAKVTAGVLSAAVAGTDYVLPGGTVATATTAGSLAANGGNCTLPNFPLGVDASGAVEGCTALPTSITGTVNEITASAATGPVTLSLASIVNLSTKTLRIPNSATPPTCSTGDIYMDIDAPSGQRLLLCEGGTFVQQGGSAGPGSTAFSAITGGDNTGAAMRVDTGASLTYINGGSINASALAGVPASSYLTTTNAAIVSGKQHVPRVVPTPASGTNEVQMNADTTDVAAIPVLTAGVTILAPIATGANPRDQQEIDIVFAPTTTPRSITWNNSWSPLGGFDLPTATTGDSAKYDFCKFRWIPALSKWVLVATTMGAAPGITTLPSNASYLCPQLSSRSCHMYHTGTPGNVNIEIPSGGAPANGKQLVLKIRCDNAQSITFTTGVGGFIASPNVPITGLTCPAGAAAWTAIGVEYSSDLNRYQVYATN